MVEGRFVELVPNVRIVQCIEFESNDPAFTGSMIMTWSLAPGPTGTEVAISCENVPDGISKEDHAMGVRRDKAALSSGCKSHPANAPAGSSRSSYGGDEVAEAFGKRVTNW